MGGRWEAYKVKERSKFGKMRLCLSSEKVKRSFFLFLCMTEIRAFVCIVVCVCRLLHCCREDRRDRDGSKAPFATTPELIERKDTLPKGPTYLHVDSYNNVAPSIIIRPMCLREPPEGVVKDRPRWHRYLYIF